ncbi:hypothetical protein [Enteractinococcus helveticum]|uniref:Lipoprotein n=1 Tax=Enteractinococcus helveticum TaxID=1837282 RepID=A0A1B7LX19_9MICC|nr:hypothetical protein [Enteractinococcus helveticum]OAV59555.1 hypothetical protein A6F49_17135 [Enteractinococcus helveticum]
MKKTPALITATLIAVTALAGCSSNAQTESAPEQDTVSVSPESAPEQVATPAISPDTRQAWADDVVNHWLQSADINSFEGFRADDPEAARGYVLDYGSDDNGTVHFTVEGDEWNEKDFSRLIHDFMGSVGYERPGELTETSVTTENGKYTFSMTCEEIPRCDTN